MVTAVLELLVATLLVWRWHVDLWRAGRVQLHELGVYGDRVLYKGVLLGVLVLVSLFAANRGARTWPRASWGLRLALAASLGESLFHALLTFSLESGIPAVLFEEPGRSAFHLVLGALAALGGLWPARAGADAD